VPREAEVAHVRVLAVDEHVARLDVSVHEPGSVCLVECPRDLVDEVERALGLEAPLAPQQIPQIGAFDVLHRDVEDAVVFAGRDRPHDVRMVEARRQLRLPEEAPPEALVPGELGREQLQRNAASRGVFREVDRAHRPLADERRDPEPRHDCACGDRCTHPVGRVLQVWRPASRRPPVAVR
jgi:hypothetical protein